MVSTFILFWTSQFLCRCSTLRPNSDIRNILCVASNFRASLSFRLLAQCLLCGQNTCPSHILANSGQVPNWTPRAGSDTKYNADHSRIYPSYRSVCPSLLLPSINAPIINGEQIVWAFVHILQFWLQSVTTDILHVFLCARILIIIGQAPAICRWWKYLEQNMSTVREHKFYVK